jgi:hypothetical protein
MLNIKFEAGAIGAGAALRYCSGSTKMMRLTVFKLLAEGSGRSRIKFFIRIRVKMMRIRNTI